MMNSPFKLVLLLVFVGLQVMCVREAPLPSEAKAIYAARANPTPLGAGFGSNLPIPRPRIVYRERVEIEGYHEPTTLCTVALGEAIGAYGNRLPKDFQGRLKNCLEVYETGVGSEFDPLLLVAISYEETSLVPQPEKSEAGAVGPLQVMPHHHCPGRVKDGCDLQQAAIIALKKTTLLFACGSEMTKRTEKAKFYGWESFQEFATHTKVCASPDWKEALCHYNSGNKCFPSSRGYAHRVLRRWGRLKAQRQLLHQLTDESRAVYED